MPDDVNAFLGIPSSAHQSTISAGNGQLSSAADEGIFSFQGRIPRSKFWAVWLSLAGAGLGVGFLVGALLQGGEGGRIIGIFLYVAFLIFNVWLGLAIQIKRWHDLGHSGWMVALNFTFIAIPICLTILGCVRGTAGPNRFGIDPLGSPDVSGGIAGSPEDPG